MKLKIDIHNDSDGEVRIDVGDAKGGDADDTITIGSAMPTKREKDPSTATTRLRAIAEAEKALDALRVKLTKMKQAEVTRLDKAMAKAAKK